MHTAMKWLGAVIHKLSFLSQDHTFYPNPVYSKVQSPNTSFITFELVYTLWKPKSLLQYTQFYWMLAQEFSINPSDICPPLPSLVHPFETKHFRALQWSKEKLPWWWMSLHNLETKVRNPIPIFLILYKFETSFSFQLTQPMFCI